MNALLLSALLFTSIGTDAVAPTPEAIEGGGPNPRPAGEAIDERAAAGGFTVRDLAGKRVRLADLRGKVVVLAFWSTWCAPCLQELPHLDSLQRARGKDGLAIIAIATDGPDTASRVASVARRSQWQMTTVHDAEGTVLARYNPRAENPFVVVIDCKGRVASKHAGYSPGDEVELAALVSAALEEP